MTKQAKVTLGIALLAILAGGLLGARSTKPAAVTPGDPNSVPVLTLPIPGSESKTPIQIAGTAPGPWFFEASFPVELRNKEGELLGQAPAHATEEWMTTKPVHFSTTVQFIVTKRTDAVIVLRKSNPSGLPEKDASYEIPTVLIP